MTWNSFGADIITLIIFLVFSAKYVKLFVCLYVCGNVLHSRPISDRNVILKMNYFCICSLIINRKKENFKNGFG